MNTKLFFKFILVIQINNRKKIENSHGFEVEINGRRSSSKSEPQVGAEKWILANFSNSNKW